MNRILAIVRYLGTVVMILMAVICSVRGFQSLAAGQPYEMVALQIMSKLFALVAVLVNTEYYE